MITTLQAITDTAYATLCALRQRLQNPTLAYAPQPVDDHTYSMEDLIDLVCFQDSEHMYNLNHDEDVLMFTLLYQRLLAAVAEYTGRHMAFMEWEHSPTPPDKVAALNVVCLVCASFEQDRLN